MILHKGVWNPLTLILILNAYFNLNVWKIDFAPFNVSYITLFYSDLETRFLVDPEEVEISCDLWQEVDNALSILSLEFRLECKSGEDSLWEWRELSKEEESPGSRFKDPTAWEECRRGDDSPLEWSETFFLDSIVDRHMGQMDNWRLQSLQNPLCPHGKSCIEAASSKHKVQAFSLTLSLFIASIFIGRGMIIFSSFESLDTWLKDWNWVLGGNLNGFHPKLNSHCWNDMKLAAGKKPELVLWKTWLKGLRYSPLRENVRLLLSMSI